MRKCYMKKQEPAPRTLTIQLDASWIDFTVPPCFPIKLPACEAATRSLVETFPATPEGAWVKSLSKPSIILL